MWKNFIFLVILLLVFNSINTQVIISRPAQVDIEKVNEGYSAKVKINDRLHELHLTKPDKSVFSETFAFVKAKSGPNGQLVFQPATPSIKLIHQLEDNLHLDKAAGAILKIDKSKSDGKTKMHGHINGIHITHNGQGHVATEFQSENLPTSKNIRDYVDIDVTLTYPPNCNPFNTDSNGEEAVTNVDVEMFVVLDNKQWTNLGDDLSTAIEYVAILVHGVNAFYKFTEDPKIHFKIVGLLTMNTTTEQPFMESARILKDNDAAFDMSKALAGFASYMYAHREILPPYDVAAFISGEEFKTYNETTELWEKGIVGLAHRKAACQVNEESEKSFKTAVIKDMGAFWRGAHPLAHEMGHLLGASHDGEAGAEGCSYSDGFVMSYTNWGSLNRFHFSQCSADMMKLYINSNQGECLRSLQAPSAWNETSLYSGDKLTMDELCRKLNGGKANYRASSTHSPTELCRMITCERCFHLFFGEVCGITGTESYTMMPGEQTPCGKDGGKCVEGDCVNIDKPT